MPGLYGMLDYYLLAVLGLRCCMQAFSSFGRWGLFSSCGAPTSHCGGCSGPGARAVGTGLLLTARRPWSVGSVVWHIGLAAPRRVGSSQARDRTCIP